MDHEGISFHGDGGKDGGVIVVACIVGGARDSLEGVAVEVEGVLAFICVVEDDVDDGAVGEDKRVGVGAVDGGVGGCRACAKGGEKGGNFGADVGYVVKEGAEEVS